MEGEYGSNYQDGYILILDLKMKTVMIHQPGGPEQNISKIMYYWIAFQLFKKSMAHPTIMNIGESEEGNQLRLYLNPSQGLPNSKTDMDEAINKYIIMDTAPSIGSKLCEVLQKGAAGR